MVMNEMNFRNPVDSFAAIASCSVIEVSKFYGCDERYLGEHTPSFGWT